MLSIFMLLIGAFSFLLPDEGNLVQNMGFIGNNPAQTSVKYMEIVGHLGTMDSKEATLFISSNRIFIKSTYISFGEIEVRGSVPEDNNMVASYPYLFNVEIGSNMNLTDKAVIGASLGMFEQRILTDVLKGYLFNLGGTYRIKSIFLSGYVRNIGSRVGYVENEKYSLPTYSAFCGTYSSGKEFFTVGVGLVNFSTSNLSMFAGYNRKISRFFSLGGEFITERDFSVGYRVKYPLRFMLAFRKNRTHIGIRFDVPFGGFDIKSHAYLGVGL